MYTILSLSLSLSPLSLSHSLSLSLSHTPSLFLSHSRPSSFQLSVLSFPLYCRHQRGGEPAGKWLGSPGGGGRQKSIFAEVCGA